jgi:hypothetical protein
MQSSVEFGGINFDNSGILLPSKGLYQVTYGVAVETPARFQLSLSSAQDRTCAVSGSALYAAVPRQLATISVLVSTEAEGSYLHIQNVTLNPSGAPVPVVLNANGGVNAFITVVKLL